MQILDQQETRLGTQRKGRNPHERVHQPASLLGRRQRAGLLELRSLQTQSRSNDTLIQSITHAPSGEAGDQARAALLRI